MIDGPGAEHLTVARSSAEDTPAFRIFQISNGATVTIDGLTISNGQAISGGGIKNLPVSTLHLTSSTISGNTATNVGGGIDNDLGTVTVTSSTISGNFASFAGGIYNIGPLTVTSSTVSGNTASQAIRQALAPRCRR